MGQILVPPATQLSGLKWLNYFSRCTEQKIESFWPKKLCQILVPTVTLVLGSKWLNFSLGALREKLSHFDIKCWVTWVETKTFKLKKTFIVLDTQLVTGSLVLLLKLLLSKIHQNYCYINYILKWFWKWF